VLREELSRIWTWEERHRRLLARLALAFLLTVCIDLIGAILAWRLERNARGTEIHGFGDALFFSTVQILSVSSSLKNPITAGAKVLDVFLEAWAIFVVTAIAGSFAAFFQTADSISSAARSGGTRRPRRSLHRSF
jgi:hypothetical protein